MFEGINWLATFVASLASLLVGFIWYNPKVFGTIWMREIGTSMEEVSGRKFNPVVMFGGTLLLSFIAAIFMNLMVAHGRTEDGFKTFQHGFVHGAQVAFFIVLPAIGTSSIYENRSWRYVAIASGFWAVTLGIIGGILNVWP